MRLKGLRPGRFIKAPPMFFTFLAVGILLLMLILHFYQNHRIDSLDEELGIALADSAALSSTIQMLKEIREKKQEILQRIDIVKDLDGRRYVFPKLMDQVSASIPELLWLTRWVPVKSDSFPLFELQGESFSNIRISEFMTRLERTSMIDEVILLNIHEKIEEGVSTMVFTLRCRYRDKLKT